MKRKLITNPKELRPGDIIQARYGREEMFTVSGNFDDYVISIDDSITVKCFAHSKLINNKFYVYEVPFLTRLVNSIKDYFWKVVV